MKKVLRVVLVVSLLAVLLCSIATAETASAKSAAGDPKVTFLGSPYLYGPSNLKIKTNGLKATLSWSADNGAFRTGYAVFQCARSTSVPSNAIWWTHRPDGYYWYPVKLIGTTTSTSMNISAPSAGDYYIEVDSYYSSYTSYVSSHGEFVTFSAKNTALSAPKTVTVEQKGKNKVKVSWTAGENAKTYAVYRKAGSGDFVKIAETKKLSYTDKSATNGTTFKYKIQASNGKKTKFSKSVKAVPMDKPSSVKAKCDKKGSVTLTWKKVKGAKNYLIFEKGPGGSEFAKVGNTTKQKTKIKVSSGNGTYKYYILPVSGSFQGLKSSKVTAHVTGAQESTKNYRALIIANRYSGNSTLQGTHNDAAALSGALKGLSQKWSVTVRKDVNANTILSAIASTFAGSTSNDICLFYYSGHGYVETGTEYEEYDGALVGNDGSPVKMSQLANALNKACGGQVIVLLDSCGSGAGIDDTRDVNDIGFAKKFTQAAMKAFSAQNKNLTDKYGELIGPKFNVLAAAATGTYSYDLNTSLNGYNCGAFTYCLLYSMGAKYPNGSFNYAMPGDANGDRALTLKETYNCICETVSYYGFDDEGNQVTQYSGNPNMIFFERK